MSALILINGNPAAGKNLFVTQIKSVRSWAFWLPKYADRSCRLCEAHPQGDHEHVFVTEKTFSRLRLDCKINFYGRRYGFNINRVGDALRKHPLVIMTITDPVMIERLINEFENDNVVPVFVYADPEVACQHAAGQAMTAQERRERLSRTATSLQTLEESRDLYREVIINHGSLGDYERKAEAFLRKYGC